MVPIVKDISDAHVAAIGGKYLGEAGDVGVVRLLAENKVGALARLVLRVAVVWVLGQDGGRGEERGQDSQEPHCVKVTTNLMSVSHGCSPRRRANENIYSLNTGD